MNHRTEHDSMGEMKVPADRLWAAQTQRSRENFEIGVDIETMPREITKAFGILKKAAARANHALKPEKMTQEKLEAAVELLREINARKPVSVELGLQTVHTETVKYIRRGYENEVYFEGNDEVLTITFYVKNDIQQHWIEVVVFNDLVEKFLTLSGIKTLEFRVVPEDDLPIA